MPYKKQQLLIIYQLMNIGLLIAKHYKIDQAAKLDMYASRVFAPFCM